MTPSVRGSLLGLALIVLVAVAFAAGRCWNEVAGTGQSAPSCESQAAQACPMMGMDHGAMPASAKSASEPAAAGGRSMAGCCSMESQEAKQTDAHPLDSCPFMGKKLDATGDPAIKKP